MTIPNAAVEEVAAILYDIGEHQNTHTFDAVHSMLREDATRILEAAAPHMLAEFEKRRKYDALAAISELGSDDPTESPDRSQ